MLTIHLGAEELFDEENSQFVISTDGKAVDLEHSLVSLSKWEEKWKKPFLGNGEKSPEEILDYVRCMILDPDFPPEDLHKLSDVNFKQIQAYINDPMTATWFSETGRKPKSRETITAELIYYWMSSAGIEWEAKYWHLNKLIALIKIYDVKNSKPVKKSRSEILREQHEINERNKKLLGTTG